MKFNAKTQRRKATARQSCNQTFWSAAGSEAPRRFYNVGRRSKSGVAAALCHRSPKSSRRMMIPGDCSAKRFEKLASSGLCAFAFIF
jgi:hypothetical protein